METTQKQQDLFGQVSGKAIEALTLWSEANQKVLQEAVTLASGGTAEGLRLYTHLQGAAVEATRAGRDFWLRRLGDLQESQRDPAAWSQKTMLEGIEESKKASTAAKENARAVMRSAEKIQATVEQTAEKVQQTLNSLAADLRSLYAPAAPAERSA